MSGLLFNFSIDPVLRAASSEGKVSILAFADDILVLGDSPSELQSLIDKLNEACRKLGLSINPSKCVTMHLGVNPTGCRPTTFTIDGISIKTILNGNHFKFLGKPTGFLITSNYNNTSSLLEKGSCILSSYLAPWQRIDAMKAFFYPSLSYAQRNLQIPKEEWNEIDIALRPKYRETLHVPSMASNDYLYGSAEDGLFGIPLAGEDADIAAIDGAYKLLTSKDHNIKQTAWDDLLKFVKHRTSPTASHDDISYYLSGHHLPRSNQISSIWTKARQASRRLEISWEICDDRSISLSMGNTSVTDRTKIFSALRAHFRKKRSRDHKNRPHQGKTAFSFFKSKASSHFHRTGDFIRFTDWRFVHKARLGLVPLNAYNYNAATKNCRRCNYEYESLPHVICHCRPNLSAITKRHNSFVQRIKTAASGTSWKILKENQPITTSALRPDLVLVRGSSALILDVAIPFENGSEAFANKRTEKENKYARVAEDLKHRYPDTRVEALIVGALGSWDPANDRILRRICSKKYLKLMRKLVVSDTIRFSRDIYTEHITGIPQVQPAWYHRSGPSDQPPHTASDTLSSGTVDPQAIHPCNQILSPTAACATNNLAIETSHNESLSEVLPTSISELTDNVCNVLSNETFNSSSPTDSLSNSNLLNERSSHVAHLTSNPADRSSTIQGLNSNSQHSNAMNSSTGVTKTVTFANSTTSGSINNPLPHPSKRPVKTFKKHFALHKNKEKTRSNSDACKNTKKRKPLLRKRNTPLTDSPTVSSPILDNNESPANCPNLLLPNASIDKPELDKLHKADAEVPARTVSHETSDNVIPPAEDVAKSPHNKEVDDEISSDSSELQLEEDQIPTGIEELVLI